MGAIVLFCQHYRSGVFVYRVFDFWDFFCSQSYCLSGFLQSGFGYGYRAFVLHSPSPG